MDRVVLGLAVAGALYLAIDLARLRPAEPLHPDTGRPTAETPAELRLLGWPRRVDWSEFETRRAHPWGVARTLASIRSTIEVSGLEVGQAREHWTVRRVEVSVDVERGHSWVKESDRTEYVRAHEQGHFDITGLIAREWLDQLREIRAASREAVLAEAERTGNELGEKLALLQRLYDHETYGGEEPQRAWLERIDRAIESGRPLPHASKFAGYGALGGSLEPY